MSIHLYQGASAVGEIAFHHAKDRPPVALLSAAERAAPAQLSSVKNAVEAAGWQAVAAYADGKPVLQVSGFEKESEIDTLLRQRGFVQGQATVTAQPGDELHSTAREKIGGNSLRFAGLANMLGNALLMVDGFKKHESGTRRDYYRTAGGGLLLLGAANLARYGNADAQHYTDEVAQDLSRYIRDQGGVTDDAKCRASNAQNFLYRYPAQVTLAVDSAGAASNLISGIRRTRSGGEWGGLGFGISSLGLKLATLAIPEKPREERKDGKRNFIEKAVDWVREKPLRLYGYGSLVNDAFLGVQAFQQYRPGKMDHVFTAGAAVSYTVADLMMAMSSKDHVNAQGKFTPDEQRGIEALAAQAVAAQPEGSRASFAERLGGFLEKKREMQGERASIGRSILEQARHRQENPWVSRAAKDAEGAPAQQSV